MSENTRALLGLLFVLVATAALAFLGRSRRRETEALRRGELKPRHPVVLLHGILGFDEISVLGSKYEYFRGVAAQLRQLGCEVYSIRVPPVGSIAARAEALALAVKALAAGRVNLIAHSMGGLDARYAISRLGLAPRVASLVTVGTPHRGTPLADALTTLVGEKLGLRRICQALSLGTEGFYELTTGRMAEFNRQVEDAPGVLYASVVGALARKAPGLHPLLRPSHFYLSRRAGPNDGLVPADSQRWGEELPAVEADHWAQIGWSGRFEMGELYAAIIRLLIARGF
jgi:triacylglycerol lipase